MKRKEVKKHQVAHERLGEVLRVLKAVIGKHQSLNSVDILSAAGTVIARVKGQSLARYSLLLGSGFSVSSAGLFCRYLSFLL